jgi:protein tyrosine/serine phosphatase
MPRYLPHLFSTLIVAMLVLVPVGFARHEQAQVRNLHVVKDRVLYRSGQMSIVGLKRVVNDLGIRTVVSLRDAAYLGEPPPDIKEEEYCRSEDIRYVRISPRTWWSPHGFVPAEEGVRTFRRIMDDPTNYPVLVHCFAGIHRTGAFCAVYRMEYEQWSNEQAIEEVRMYGYDNLDEEWDILSYLEHYRPRWRPRDQVEPPDVARPVNRARSRSRRAKDVPIEMRY